MGFLDRLKSLRKSRTRSSQDEGSGVTGDMAQIELEPEIRMESPDSETPTLVFKKPGFNLKGFSRKKNLPSNEEGSGPETEENSSLSFRYEDTGVLVFNGEAFAANMIWVVDLEGNTAREHIPFAQKMAQGRDVPDQSFELCSDRKGADYYGFGSKDSGHRRKMPILIESFDQSVMGRNWLVILPLEGRPGSFWLGSRRDGLVFEDRIFTSQEKAAEAFFDMISAPDWGMIVAPAEWAVQDSLHEIPASALVEKKYRKKLSLTDPLRSYAPRIIMVSVLLSIAAGGGFYFYDRHQKHLAEMEELRRRVEQAITLAPQDFPWFHRTSLEEFVSLCETEILNTMVLVTGWENQQFTCRIERGRGTVSTGWTRAGGNVSWLRASMPRDFPSISVHPSITSATVSRSFTAPIDPTALEVEPWSRDLIESRLNERFQVLEIDGNLRFVRDNRPADTNPLFNRHDLQIQGSMGLSDIIEMISDVPALIPETLNYNLASNSWSLVLRIHHPVILPEFTQ